MFKVLTLMRDDEFLYSIGRTISQYSTMMPTNPKVFKAKVKKLQEREHHTEQKGIFDIIKSFAK